MLPDKDTAATSAFFADLMASIMGGTMIPKVQIERIVGPILGFFLPQLLSEMWKQTIVMMSPEFPIRKTRLDAETDLSQQHYNQSTNIDWLMFNHTTNELLLVELKTTDTTYRVQQSEVYRSVQDAITQRQSSAFLVEELRAIQQASQEGGKYRNVHALLAQALGVAEGEVAQRLAQCAAARIVYIAPRISKPADWTEDSRNPWLSFTDLPEQLYEHPHAAFWPILRKELVALDTLSRRERNGLAAITDSGRNYEGLLRGGVPLLQQCRQHGSAIVIGWMNWRSTLSTLTAAEFEARTYKWDWAVNGKGSKVEKNWIAGDVLLRHWESLSARLPD